MTKQRKAQNSKGVTGLLHRGVINLAYAPLAKCVTLLLLTAHSSQLTAHINALAGWRSCDQAAQGPEQQGRHWAAAPRRHRGVINLAYAPLAKCVTGLLLTAYFNALAGWQSCQQAVQGPKQQGRHWAAAPRRHQLCITLLFGLYTLRCADTWVGCQRS